MISKIENIEFIMIAEQIFQDHERELLRPHELGWIAGILDMKGVIVRKRNQMRRTTQTVMIVETRHRDLVLRLSKYTGTDPAIQSERRIKEEWARRGCVEHCPEKHNHIQTISLPQISRWQVTGSSLAVVVFNVMPYLTDNERTRAMIEAMESVSSTIPLKGQGRSAIDQALRRLANLGWIIPDYLLPAEHTLF